MFSIVRQSVENAAFQAAKYTVLHKYPRAANDDSLAGKLYS
jgi:hypothetical protein